MEFTSGDSSRLLDSAVALWVVVASCARLMSFKERACASCLTFDGAAHRLDLRAMRLLLASALLLVGLVGCGESNQGTKPIRKVVGLAQIGAESAWRTANTKSIRDEAAKRGYALKFSDAQQKQENQILALRTFIAQGVAAIILPPVVETGFEPILKDAKAAGIPVILADRVVTVSDQSLYVTFIGADFVEEGRKAAAWLASSTGKKAVIAELEGSVGSAPANDRKKGFAEGIAIHPGMKVVWSQSGDFTRAKGKEALEAFLKTPMGQTITAVYAHNDDMALGAIQALEEAGKVPGRDVTVIGIDGVRAAFESVAAGEMGCTVECTPLIGPLVFDAIDKVLGGASVPRRIVTPGGVFDRKAATEALPKREY